MAVRRRRHSLATAAAATLVLGAGAWFTCTHTGTSEASGQADVGGSPSRGSTEERVPEHPVPPNEPPAESNVVALAKPRVDVRLDPDGEDPDRDDPKVETRRQQGADPIAAVIPMLSDRTPAQQLRTLRWMESVSGEKLVSAFPDLGDARVPLAEREQTARERLALLEEQLEQSAD